MNGLASSILTIGLAITIFLAITMSVRFWPTTGTPSEVPSGAAAVPSYTVSQLHP